MKVTTMFNPGKRDKMIGVLVLHEINRVPYHTVVAYLTDGGEVVVGELQFGEHGEQFTVYSPECQKETMSRYDGDIQEYIKQEQRAAAALKRRSRRRFLKQ